MLRVRSPSLSPFFLPFFQPSHKSQTEPANSHRQEFNKTEELPFPFLSPRFSTNAAVIPRDILTFFLAISFFVWYIIHNKGSFQFSLTIITMKVCELSHYVDVTSSNFAGIDFQMQPRLLILQLPVAASYRFCRQRTLL